MPAFTVQRLKEAADKAATHAAEGFKRDGFHADITCTYELLFRMLVVALLLDTMFR